MTSYSALRRGQCATRWRWRFLPLSTAAGSTSESILHLNPIMVSTRQFSRSFSQATNATSRPMRKSDVFVNNFSPRGGPSFASQMQPTPSSARYRRDTGVEYVSCEYTAERTMVRSRERGGKHERRVERKAKIKDGLNKIKEGQAMEESMALLNLLKQFPWDQGTKNSSRSQTPYKRGNLSKLNKSNGKITNGRSFEPSSILSGHDKTQSQPPSFGSYPKIGTAVLASKMLRNRTGGKLFKNDIEPSKKLETERFSSLRKRRSSLSDRMSRRRKGKSNTHKEATPETLPRKRLNGVKIDRMTAFTVRSKPAETNNRKPEFVPVLPLTCTMRELSRILGTKVVDLTKVAHDIGIENVTDANSKINQEGAELIAMELDITCELEKAVEIDVHAQLDDQMQESIPIRPPLVCVMGHVDHGKTTLLDKFRHTHVAEKEAGGITQAIGAFPIPVPNPGMITMFDTPGHAAFNSMRSRGAHLVDTVLLVVAADEGVKPQTIESIRLAKSAHVPIVVAINKMDRPGSNPGHVIKQLREHGLVHEDDGGDTPMIECSAKTGDGLDSLLKTVSFVAEMQEPRAEIECNAEAITLETAVDRKRGSTANVLVRKGTLRVGDYFVVDKKWGKVKRMTDHNNKQIKEAGPSLPVTVYGLDGVVGVGKDFIVVENEAAAKKIIEYRIDQEKYENLESLKDSKNTNATMPTAETMEMEKKEVLVIIKGSTAGALEALVDYVDLIETPGDAIEIKVVKSSVGAISESDVRLSNDLDAVLLGFDVKFSNGAARKVAKSLKVPVMMNSVIFKVMDDFCDHLTEALPDQYEDIQRGQGKVKDLFRLNGRNSAGVKPVVAGCRIDSGRFVKKFGFRVVRNQEVIYEQQSPAASLKHFKDKVEEVIHGHDCGLDLGEFTSYEVGDVIQCTERVKSTKRVVPPTFSSDLRDS